jgi:hypothetical protein
MYAYEYNIRQAPLPARVATPHRFSDGVLCKAPCSFDRSCDVFRDLAENRQAAVVSSRTDCSTRAACSPPAACTTKKCWTAAWIFRFCAAPELEANPSEPQLIRTERSVGYEFAVPVEVL